MTNEYIKCSRCALKMHESLFPSNKHGKTNICKTCVDERRLKAKPKTKVSETENGEPITTWLNGSDELYC